MNNLAIVVCGDTNYYSHPHATITALSSFREKFGDSVDYVCVTDCDKPDTKYIVEKNRFKYVHVDMTCYTDIVSDYGLDRWTTATFFKSFSLPKLLLQLGYEYTLYVDGDVLCTQKFTFPEQLESNHACGVRSLNKFKGRHEFNCGVMFYNNVKYTEDKLYESALEFSTGKKFNGDQLIFNDMVDNNMFHVSELNITYNYMLYKQEKHNRLNDCNLDTDTIKMVHFLGKKPWTKLGARDTNWNYPIYNHFYKMYNDVQILV